MQPFDLWAVQEEAVFIVGPARSGTTIMYRTLVEAPGFWAMRGLPESRAFSAGELEKRPLMRETKAYLGSRHDSFIAAADANALSSLALIRFYFHEASKQFSAGRLVEKTPAHVFSIPDLFTAFPKARIVVMLRNARDIVISHRARLNRDRARGAPAADIHWLGLPINELLDNLQCVEQAIGTALARWPDRVTCVSYERLIVDTASELRFAGGRLNMPPADIEDMIVRSMSPRKTGPKHTAFPVRDAPIGETVRHSGLLTAEEEAAISAVSFVHLRA